MCCLLTLRSQGDDCTTLGTTAATLLLEEGGDLQQVKDLLGHSQISVSSRYYAHATDRLAQDSAARLGWALFGDSTV